MALQSPPEPEPVLAGTIVLERGTGLATAAIGNLLASLGATVLRLESDADSAAFARATPAEQRLRAGGKRRVCLGPDMEATWRRCAAAAEVLLCDPLPADAPEAALQRARLEAGAPDKVLCVVSGEGMQGAAGPELAEPLLQALGGAMAVTGAEGGPPEFIRVPIVSLSAAVIGASAILGALRVRRRDGSGQVIDLSLIGAAADQLRLHMPLLEPGQEQAFRQGCRHPICCPWNAYRAQDGWVVICSSSDAQWQALLGVIGRAEVRADASLARAAQRRARIDEVDAMVQGWVGGRTAAATVAAVAAVGIPAGEVARVPQVLANPVLRRRGAVITSGGMPAFGTALGLRRSPVRYAMLPDAPGGVPALPAATPQAATALPAARPVTTAAAMPLAGLRVIELSRYTAGPLAGMVLAGLGAEVIKVESPGGEETRRWQPQYDGVSGYFLNHNLGKRSVTLDLRNAEGARALAALVADSDVLLQNLRPGVMDKIGLGAAAATARQPRLIHATISGYGLDGPDDPALDTVIQAVGGLIALVGESEPPCRVGFSIADQISGHLTALVVLAAVIERDRSGRGQIIDIAMADAIAWLTQLAWPDGDGAIGPTSRWQAKDGFVVAAADEASVRAALAGAGASLTRAEWVAACARQGIAAAPVLEPAEVFAQQAIRDRDAIFAVRSGTATAPALALPFGLLGTPALRPGRIAALGEDNTLLDASARETA